jgi:hypothetical protein
LEFLLPKVIVLIPESFYSCKTTRGKRIGESNIRNGKRSRVNLVGKRKGSWAREEVNVQSLKKVK